MAGLIAGDRYVNIKPKDISRRKQPLEKQNSFVQPNLLKRYAFIKKELQSRYGSGLFSDRRALQVLYMNDFELIRSGPFAAPQWVVRIQEVIDKYANQINILGGGLKDIILFGNYAYTFHVPTKIRPREKYYDYEKRLKEYELHLKELASFDYFGGLNEKVRDRLNFAKADAIYSQDFVEKDGATRRVIITKVPICEQSDLTKFIMSKPVSYTHLTLPTILLV